MKDSKKYLVAAALVGTLFSAFLVGCGEKKPPIPESKVNPALGRPAPNDPATSNATLGKTAK